MVRKAGRCTDALGRSENDGSGVGDLAAGEGEAIMIFETGMRWTPRSWGYYINPACPLYLTRRGTCLGAEDRCDIVIGGLKMF